jgi:hypothetical protein
MTTIEQDEASAREADKDARRMRIERDVLAVLTCVVLALVVTSGTTSVFAWLTPVALGFSTYFANRAGFFYGRAAEAYRFRASLTEANAEHG